MLHGWYTERKIRISFLLPKLVVKSLCLREEVDYKYYVMAGLKLWLIQVNLDYYVKYI